MRLISLLLLLAACSPSIDRAVYPPPPPRDAAATADDTSPPATTARPTCTELLAMPSVPTCPAGDNWAVSSVPCAEAADTTVPCHVGCWGSAPNPTDVTQAGQLWDCQFRGIVCVSAVDRCR